MKPRVSEKSNRVVLTAQRIKAQPHFRTNASTSQSGQAWQKLCYPPCTVGLREGTQVCSLPGARVWPLFSERNSPTNMSCIAQDCEVWTTAMSGPGQHRRIIA